jgi:hypothetical protein
MAFRHLTLIVVDGIFAVGRLEPDATISPWATAGDFFSITDTGFSPRATVVATLCRALPSREKSPGLFFRECYPRKD